MTPAPDNDLLNLALDAFLTKAEGEDEDVSALLPPDRQRTAREWAVIILAGVNPFTSRDEWDEEYQRLWAMAVREGIDPLDLGDAMEAYMAEEDARRSKSAQGTKSSVRRTRGPGKDSLILREFVTANLVPQFDRMTVRQVFYQAASVAGLVPKTDSGRGNGYAKVQRQILAMRLAGELDWEFIADGTRWQRKPSTWASSDDALDNMIRGYRRDLWQSQGVRIEIWLEKDALADVIIDTCSRWDVPLMVSRGQSSATFLHNAGQAAREMWESHRVKTYVYTLYDYDEGGFLRAAPTVARDLPKHAGPGVPVTVTHLALTPQQIAPTSAGGWGLPTRPGKSKDPQVKQWGNRPHVELDAIDPNRLNALVEGAILRHVDPHKWEVQQAIEAEEREGLERLAAVWRNGADQ